MEINNHFDAVVECCDFLHDSLLNDNVSKQDVIESMEMRMHILMRRAVCTTTFPYMSMSDWQLVTDVS
jgi:hypothetical protein